MERADATDIPLRPYVACAGHLLAALDLDAIDGARHLDPLDPSSRDALLALNRGNRFAYDATTEPSADPGALGMPLWVMLDCCLLPTAMVGFEAPRDRVPARIADSLDPEGRLDWLGVSEYVAIPSARAGEVVGVSLFSLLPNLRLGRRTKALGLLALRARTQVGVTQYTNPSIRLHLAFGALRVLAPRVEVHSRPEETFVYSLRVPDRDVLTELLADRRERAARGESPAETGSLDPRSDGALRAFAEGIGRESPWIVSAGPVEEGRLTRIGWAADGS